MAFSKHRDPPPKKRPGATPGVRKRMQDLMRAKNELNEIPRGKGGTTIHGAMQKRGEVERAQKALDRTREAVEKRNKKKYGRAR